MTKLKKTINNSVRYVSNDDNWHIEHDPSISESRPKTRMRKKKASTDELSQKNKKTYQNYNKEKDFEILND